MSIFSRSADSLAVKGDDPERSQNPQARILYVFEKDSHRPVFYRVVQASIIDKAAFMDTVNAAVCSDCIIVVDKGFYSKKGQEYKVSAIQKKTQAPLDTIGVNPLRKTKVSVLELISCVL